MRKAGTKSFYRELREAREFPKAGTSFGRRPATASQTNPTAHSWNPPRTACTKTNEGNKVDPTAPQNKTPVGGAFQPREPDRTKARAGSPAQTSCGRTLTTAATEAEAFSRDASGKGNQASPTGAAREGTAGLRSAARPACRSGVQRPTLRRGGPGLPRLRWRRSRTCLRLSLASSRTPRGTGRRFHDRKNRV